MKFPTTTSGPIPNDPYGRTYAELDHWYRQQGTNLHQQCCVERATQEKIVLLRLAKSGAKRPQLTDYTGKALRRYTQPGGYYDHDFDTQIRKLRPDWFVTKDAILRAAQARRKKEKQTLLRMAQGGVKRPSASAKDPAEKFLGRRLIEFVNENRELHDPFFAKKIKAMRPSWFGGLSTERKRHLLMLARDGSQKPSAWAKQSEERQLADALRCYTSSTRSSYDGAFDEEIRRLRPEWWQTSADLKKEVLLQRARSGDTKPHFSNGDEKSLSVALSCYTREGHYLYDAKFTKELRLARSDWFSKPPIAKAELLVTLLQLAKSGAPKPQARSSDPDEKRLGNALARYMAKGKSHDRAFSKKIQRLRSEWFARRPIEIRKNHKETLYKLARIGADRPSAHRTAKLVERRLGAALIQYTKKETHDPVFNEEIRQLRPDWFPQSIQRKTT